MGGVVRNSQIPFPRTARSKTRAPNSPTRGGADADALFAVEDVTAMLRGVGGGPVGSDFGLDLEDNVSNGIYSGKCAA